ncbi:MAG: hypothetical protein R2932_30725 [Caldilineaceae bacterium]
MPHQTHGRPIRWSGPADSPPPNYGFADLPWCAADTCSGEQEDGSSARGEPS